MGYYDTFYDYYKKISNSKQRTCNYTTLGHNKKGFFDLLEKVCFPDKFVWAFSSHCFTPDPMLLNRDTIPGIPADPIRHFHEGFGLEAPNYLRGLAQLTIGRDELYMS